MCHDVLADLGEGGLERGRGVGFQVKAAPRFGGLPEQVLAGVKPDGVGNQIVRDFLTLEVIYIRAQINFVQRLGHTDHPVPAAGAVTATQRAGRTTPTPAVGQQDEKVLLAPVADR